MWLRLGMMAWWCASAAGAVDWSQFRQQGYVSDFARVVDPDSRARLEAYCQAVERATGTQIALVVLPSLEGEPVADVAQSLYSGWAVGQRNSGGGVLVLMAVRDRRVHIARGRSLARLLPTGTVLREMGPALRERDFNEAAVAAAETIGLSVAHARRVPLSAGLTRRLRPGFWDSFPWPMLLGGVLLLLFLFRFGGVRGDGSGARGLLPGLIGGRAIARSTWGANGSGGFGGYDSGDGGSGGFGGGDCPGRAASDW